MTLSFSDTLADDPAFEAKVKEIFSTLESRPLPLGSFHRLMSLGGLNANLFVHYTSNWFRGFFQNREAREKSLADTHIHCALKVLERMGYLRGVVMKLGQTMAHCPEVVPQEWARVLSRLQWEAPPMHYSLVREQLVSELGDEPENIFADFDRKAFAAASLGQVHRARLKTGEEVAVKIQYPGIASTIQTDLRNIQTLSTPLRFTAGWRAVMGMYQDLREVMEQETDYVLEAARQTEAGELFKDHPHLRVAKVFPEFSTARILTSELLPGVHMDDFLAQGPPQEKRDHFGGLMFEAMLRLMYQKRWIYADANAGNYLLAEDGSLGLIDFGNVRPFSDDEWAYYRETDKAMVRGDFEGMVEAARKGLRPGMNSELNADQEDWFHRWTDWSTRPMCQEGVFDFGMAFWREGIELFAQSLRIRIVEAIPMVIHLTRAVMTGRALTARLESRFDAQACHRKILKDVGLAEA
ncbi:AarF/ABC1/UbiB kinase family protein [bacterium AH-315-F18]|nr:AarF/ABC1/UbiB kinase family protein [bacterium AH-315-F18]